MKRKLSLSYLKEHLNDKVTSFAVFGFVFEIFQLFDMQIKHCA